MQRRIWEDPAFRALSADARLLFLWSWTNPKATICGLYTVTLYDLRLAIAEPPAPARRVLKAIVELEEKPLVRYDGSNEVMWVVSRVKHANRSPKVARAMQRELEDCPASPLVDDFVQMYGAQLGVEIEEEK